MSESRGHNPALHVASFWRTDAFPQRSAVAMRRSDAESPGSESRSRRHALPVSKRFCRVSRREADAKTVDERSDTART